MPRGPPRAHPPPVPCAILTPRHAAPRRSTPPPPLPPLLQVKALAAHPEHARLHALLDVFAHGEGLAAYHKWLAGGSERDLEALGISNVCPRSLPAHARARTRAQDGGAERLTNARPSHVSFLPAAGALRRDDPPAVAVLARLGQQVAEL